jgi:hypothetical protein
LQESKECRARKQNKQTYIFVKPTARQGYALIRRA